MAGPHRVFRKSWLRNAVMGAGYGILMPEELTPIITKCGESCEEHTIDP